MDTPTTDTAYDAAIAYAADRGAQDGRNAAEWWLQDTIGGRVRPRVDRMAAGAILRGLADGDPAVLDILPYADLSGEWADTLTGPQLVAAALDAGEGGDYMGWYSDVCDAYEAAFSEAVEAEVSRAARAVLA